MDKLLRLGSIAISSCLHDACMGTRSADARLAPGQRKTAATREVRHLRVLAFVECGTHAARDACPRLTEEVRLLTDRGFFCYEARKESAAIVKCFV